MFYVLTLLSSWDVQGIKFNRLVCINDGTIVTHLKLISENSPESEMNSIP
uniref:Uncharacterized protein n=1 Tax=Arion vulgaris TaxID=1028688 RepID=A0A0B6ZCZ5_9EUPU